ncbi:TPA: DNA primase [Escherichia coli]|nr:DNA primase [Escherichia coli]HBA8910731.1 DNA primase [Escherichia coli]HBA9699979.1 DNA primase [Escherichia coli]HBI8126423.1 DNA primase [Escherichia coli]
MKLAPNLKKQPRDRLTEVIIFAGSDAWSHAKEWQEWAGKHIAADNVPPVVLADEQLKNITDYRIIDDGRECVRIYCAGHITERSLTQIATLLAVAGVQNARCWRSFADKESPEDWSPRLAGLKAEYERGESLVMSSRELAASKKVVELPVKKKERIKDDKASSLALNQMGASQRGEVLLARYGGELAIHADSDTVHHYNGVVWEPVQDKELQRAMAQIFIDAEISYSQNAIKSAVDTMKLSLPVMGNTARNLIGFSNGVFDTRTGNFRKHNKNDWLLIASELPFSPPAEGETLATHAPNFWKWLRRSVAENDRKADRVLAALFMVLANRYDWQLFIEVTGPGGSGKSVMAEICTMLAGKANTVSASMKALEDARERALVVGFSLIIMPDMTRYAGDGAGIKAITGGDKVAIDPKHKAPYSTRIPAVVLAVNNNAMSFSDRSGGISRRRVIFNFSEVVPENERDSMLAEKIEGELAVVIRHLLTRFADQDEARRLLYEQQKSEEALAIKREGDSLVDFCGYLMASVMCDGLLVGNAEIVPFSPRRYLYHAYLAYMRAHGFGKPVTLTRFGKDMPGAMAEYGREYMKRKTKHGLRSNVTLTEESEDWMPSCVSVTNDDSKN